MTEFNNWLALYDPSVCLTTTWEEWMTEEMEMDNGPSQTDVVVTTQQTVGS